MTRRIAPIAGYGAASWAIVLAVAMCIGALRDTDRPLFESVMAITVTACGVILGLRFRRRWPLHGLARGAVIGLVWAAVNIALDLPLFSWGPMAMPLPTYFKDIGLTYLIYPLIMCGLATRTTLPP